MAPMEERRIAGMRESGNSGIPFFWIGDGLLAGDTTKHGSSVIPEFGHSVFQAY